MTLGVVPGSGVQPATSRPRTRTVPQLPTVRRLTTLPPPLWRATLYKTGGRCEPAARGDRVHHDEHHTLLSSRPRSRSGTCVGRSVSRSAQVLSVRPGCCPIDTLIWPSRPTATLKPTPSAPEHGQPGPGPRPGPRLHAAAHRAGQHPVVPVRLPHQQLLHPPHRRHDAGQRRPVRDHHRRRLPGCTRCSRSCSGTGSSRCTSAPATAEPSRTRSGGCSVGATCG